MTICEERDFLSRRRRAAPWSSAMIILYVCRASFSSRFFFLLPPLLVNVHPFSFSATDLVSPRSVIRARVPCTRETPRYISSIFKQHGLSARGSASIYKASGALGISCLGAVVVVSPRRERGIRIVRGSVTKSIRCRRAAFYLHPPSATSFSHSRHSISLYVFVRCLSPSLSTFFPLDHPLHLLHSLATVPCSIRRFPFSFLFLFFRRSTAFSPVLVTVTAGGCSLARCCP